MAVEILERAERWTICQRFRFQPELRGPLRVLVCNKSNVKRGGVAVYNETFIRWVTERSRMVKANGVSVSAAAVAGSKQMALHVVR